MRLDFLTGKYGLQFLLLIFIAAISLIIFQLISFLLIFSLTPFELNDLIPKLNLLKITSINEGYWVFFILSFSQSIGVFILPGLIFKWLSRHSQIVTFNFNLKTSINFLVSLPLFVIAGVIVVGFLGELNMKLYLPQMFVDMENTATETVNYILSFRSPGYVALNILLICILPAIGEELFFRGVIQKIFVHWTKKNWIAILITAIIFSAIHFQFLTFLPRFFMGIMLGYLFVWSRNLLIPIIAHFLHNLFSIIVAYSTDTMDMREVEPVNIFIVMIAVLVMGGIGYWYYLDSKKHHVS